MKKYIYIYYGRLQTLKLWGGRFLNLGKPSLSIYINVDQKSLVTRGNERKGEGKKQLFSFILFFFFGSSTRWKKFPFRFYTEIILEVLYRFRKTMGRVVGELGKEVKQQQFLG